MASQLIIPRQLDANGDPASGAKAYVYETGTTTPVTVYTDTALSVAHASPIVADSAGYFAQAFYGGATALKVVVTDSADATLVTYDPVPLVSLSSSAASDVTFSPTTEIPQTTVQAAIVAVEAKVMATADIADDAITRAKIADAAMSGDDATLITGTAGTDGNLAQWNADGDLVDGPDLQSTIDASVALTVAAENTATGGTEIDFTSIPAGVSEIEVYLTGVSLSGTDNLLVQIGDVGGTETTGYVSTVNGTNSTSGFIVYASGASRVNHGILHLRHIGSNKWVCGVAVGLEGVAQTGGGGGYKTLSATLDRVRITATGSDTIDANAGVSIAYR